MIIIDIILVVIALILSVWLLTKGYPDTLGSVISPF